MDMPFAQVKVIEGVFSDTQKRDMIEKVTDAIVSVEGENLRDKTFVVIEEIKSGDWGIGGKTVTAEQIRELKTAKAS
jgi:4-oxalocrotonate tautomerase